MPSDNTNKEDTPPVDEQTASDDSGVEPREWTLTEEDIREIEASGLTLGDVIRELGLDIEAERHRV